MNGEPRSLQQDDPDTLFWLALTRKSQGRQEEAVAIVRKCLELRPHAPEALNLLGVCLLALGRAPDAEAAFRALVEVEPSSAAAHANLGMALRLQNCGVEALTAFQKALELDSEESQNYLQVFKQLQQLSRLNEALEVLKAGLERHPESVVLAEALALAYGRLKRPEDAEQIFGSISQASPQAANSYANWLQEEGRFKDSITVLHHSLRLQPAQGAAYRSLVEAKQYDHDGQSILGVAQGMIQDPKLNDSGRMHMAYAIGKLLEAEERYEEAIRSFDFANQIAYRTYPACQAFNAAHTDREPDLAKRLYSAEFVNRLRRLGCTDDRPIFLVGMIRSGTTLLDQIVSSHPDVASMGEGTFWNAESDSIHSRWNDTPPNASEIDALAGQYLTALGVAPDTVRFTDKMPLNYRNLGLINITFPEGRIIHIRRDPFDTCMSIYATFFAGGPSFAYSARNIVTFYRAYQRYMQHWRDTLPEDRFFELDYESLVTDPDPITRRIITFLGMKWDDSCLRHVANKNQVSTPSRWQVRQPIYTTSVGKRSNYAPYAKEFAEL